MTFTQYRLIVHRMPAHELQSGFKWPITVGRAIAAPAQAVWSAISMPGNLELCHPFCASNPTLIWSGPESWDEVCYLSGLVFERHFNRWIEGVGYDLEIGVHGGETSSVSWRICPVDHENCILEITVYPYLLQKLPVAVRWLPHMLRLRPMLKNYLESVIKGFEWYVTFGEPVPRDCFGRHAWFSASQ